MLAIFYTSLLSYAACGSHLPLVFLLTSVNHTTHRSFGVSVHSQSQKASTTVVLICNIETSYSLELKKQAMHCAICYV